MWLLRIAICFVAAFGGLLLIVFFRFDEEGRRAAQTHANLKLIATAMHEYHAANGRLPPALVLGADGKPAHSWCVLILPYVGQQDLYSRYDFNVPWNHESNKRLLREIPLCYTSIRNLSNGSFATSFVVLTGEKTFFPNSRSVNWKDAKDGLESTILIAEAERSDILWTEPEDLNVDTVPPSASEISSFGLTSGNAIGPSVALGDATVVTLRSDSPIKSILSLSTISDDDEVAWESVRFRPTWVSHLRLWR